MTADVRGSVHLMIAALDFVVHDFVQFVVGFGQCPFAHQTANTYEQSVRYPDRGQGNPSDAFGSFPKVIEIAWWRWGWCFYLIVRVTFNFHIQPI